MGKAPWGEGIVMGGEKQGKELVGWQGERIWENGWCRGGDYGRHSTRRVGQECPAYAVRGADPAAVADAIGGDGEGERKGW